MEGVLQLEVQHLQRLGPPLSFNRTSISQVTMIRATGVTDISVCVAHLAERLSVLQAFGCAQRCGVAVSFAISRVMCSNAQR